MEKLAYSIREAAEVLGISKSLAYQLAKEKQIPIIRLGNRIVVPVKQLEKFIETERME